MCVYDDFTETERTQIGRKLHWSKMLSLKNYVTKNHRTNSPFSIDFKKKKTNNLQYKSNTEKFIE